MKLLYCIVPAQAVCDGTIDVANPNPMGIYPTFDTPEAALARYQEIAARNVENPPMVIPYQE